MELQFNKQSLDCLRPVAAQVHNEEQTQEVRLPDALPDIGKVLAAWGQALIRGKEWRRGGMTVSGGVMVWILYAPEDGSEPRSLETWIPFQMKWDFPETDRDGTILAACLVKSVDARSVSARKLMVRVGISCMGEALTPGQEDLFSPDQVPEDVELLMQSYPVRLPREAGETTFTLEEELTLPASCPVPEKIIRCCLQTELTEQKVMAGKVVFRGAAILHLLYRGEEGQLKAWDFEIPFSQFADLEGNYQQDPEARVIPAVTSLELELGEEKQLRLKAGLTGQYVVYDHPVVEVVEDAYSPRRTVTPRLRPLALPMVLDDRRETLHLEKTLEMPGSQVVDLAFWPDHPTQRRNGDLVELEVSGTFQMLCYDEEGKLRGETARQEETWSLPADENSRVSAISWPSGTPQGTMGGGSASLRGDVRVDTVTMADHGLPMVTALELGELTEPDPARPSLILRRAGTERLWDLAKGSGSTVETIRRANSLTEDPEPGKILLIPVS